MYYKDKVSGTGTQEDCHSFVIVICIKNIYILSAKNEYCNALFSSKIKKKLNFSPSLENSESK